MKLVKFLFPLILLILCFSACKKEVVYGDEVNLSKYAESNEKIEKYLTQQKFHGAVLVACGDEVRYAKGFGLSDSKNKKSDPITINSTFEIGSITKQMTAAAIMQLAQKKLLSVDDDITKYFPEFTNGKGITIKLLLNMRSGLTDFINNPEDFFGSKVARQIEKKMYANTPIEKDFVMKYLYDAPIIAAPDATNFYCNTNFYLLGKIIEQVSGQSYEDYMVEHIFKPCNLTKTNLDFCGSETVGYDWKGRSCSFSSEFSFACGNVNSSVVDLFKWQQNLVNAKVVSKKSYAQMIDTQSYGFGLFCENGEIFHAGSTLMFNSFLIYYPESKITIIVLMNEPAGQKTATMVGRAIYTMIDKDR